MTAPSVVSDMMPELRLASWLPAELPGLLEGVLDNPESLTHRLVLADLLDEHALAPARSTAIRAGAAVSAHYGTLSLRTVLPGPLRQFVRNAGMTFSESVAVFGNAGGTAWMTETLEDRHQTGVDCPLLAAEVEAVKDLLRDPRVAAPMLPGAIGTRAGLLLSEAAQSNGPLGSSWAVSSLFVFESGFPGWVFAEQFSGQYWVDGCASQPPLIGASMTFYDPLPVFYDPLNIKTRDRGWWLFGVVPSGWRAGDVPGGPNATRLPAQIFRRLISQGSVVEAAVRGEARVIGRANGDVLIVRDRGLLMDALARSTADLFREFRHRPNDGLKALLDGSEPAQVPGGNVSAFAAGRLWYPFPARPSRAELAVLLRDTGCALAFETGYGSAWD